MKGSGSMLGQLISRRSGRSGEKPPSGGDPVTCPICSPARGVIHRILRRRGLITAQPKSGPGSSCRLFESILTNESWQTERARWILDGDWAAEVIKTWRT
jgi:hypothetical protein